LNSAAARTITRILLVFYPPKATVSKLVNSLKGVSSRLLRDHRPGITGRYKDGVLWSPSYFAGSCGGAPLSVKAAYSSQPKKGHASSPLKDGVAGAEAKMIKSFRTIALTVNGEDVCETVEPRTSLVDFLRERLGLTGSHVGCEQGVCGACTVRLDGVTARGCLVLAVQCTGSKVETIEGVSDAGEIADLQDAFARRNALQCGFCTPGMLLAAQELLAQCGMPSRQQI
jgi:aerobic carbon-monoxide dehydrogenase small subunit